MSEFRVEKVRTEAELTLATGGKLRGSFFLSSSAAKHGGSERVADLLNAEPGFFPFETPDAGRAGTVLVNRAHIIAVKLIDRTTEAQLDPGYALATERQVDMLLSNGARVRGCVRVYRPQGRDRLSDYARSPEMFRYIETPRGTMVINTAHIVELRETGDRSW